MRGKVANGFKSGWSWLIAAAIIAVSSGCATLQSDPNERAVPLYDYQIGIFFEQHAE